MKWFHYVLMLASFSASFIIGSLVVDGFYAKAAAVLFVWLVGVAAGAAFHAMSVESAQKFNP